MLRFTIATIALFGMLTGPASAQSMAGKTLKMNFALSMKICHKGTGRCASEGTSGVQDIYFGTGGNVYEYKMGDSSAGRKIRVGQWADEEGARSRYVLTRTGAIYEIVKHPVSIKVIVTNRGDRCDFSLDHKIVEPTLTLNVDLVSRQCLIINGNPHAS